MLDPMPADEMGKPTEASPFAAQVVAQVVHAEIDARREDDPTWNIEQFCLRAKMERRNLERWKNGRDVANPLWSSLYKIRDAFRWDDRTLLERLREAAARMASQASASRGSHASSGGAPAGGGPAFVIGRAVDRDEDFVGRDASVQRVVRSIQHRQAVQLVGPARMGKTSLLLRVRRLLSRSRGSAERPVVWIDAADRSSPATLVHAIATALGRADLVQGWGAHVAPHEAADLLKRLPAFVLLLDDAHKLARNGRGFD
jgi:hypothetical protein